MKKAIFFLILVMICGIVTVYFLQNKGSFSFDKPLFEGIASYSKKPKKEILVEDDGRNRNIHTNDNSDNKQNLEYDNDEENEELDERFNRLDSVDTKHDTQTEKEKSHEVTSDEIEKFHSMNELSDSEKYDDFNLLQPTYQTKDNFLNPDNDIERIINQQIRTTESTTQHNTRKVKTSFKIEHKGELKKRYPQVIIAGVKKGGTRALISFLAKHPMVRSAGQEVHFFDKDINYSKGIKWYLSKMPESYENEITVEKTPGYFVRPNVPERIYKLSRDIKFLFIFRDPVTRAISDYAQSIAKRNESQTEKREFEKQVFIKGVRPRVVNQNNSKIYIGLYAQHLKRWLHYFPLKQFLFIDGDAFIKNPAPALIKVQKFLNLPLLVREDSFIYNKQKGFYCVALYEQYSNKTSSGCLGPTKGRKQPFVKKKTIEKLKEFFRPYNKEFFNLIEDNFGWPS